MIAVKKQTLNLTSVAPLKVAPLYTMSKARIGFVAAQGKVL